MSVTRQLRGEEGREGGEGRRGGEEGRGGEGREGEGRGGEGRKGGEGRRGVGRITKYFRVFSFCSIIFQFMNGMGWGGGYNQNCLFFFLSKRKKFIPLHFRLFLATDVLFRPCDRRVLQNGVF